MDRQSALQILSSQRESLTRQFSVASLAIFGSVARGEATDTSDIDLLVEFNGPVGLFAFIRLQQHLEELLGCKVDLVTPDALRKEMRERILKEAIRAA